MTTTRKDTFCPHCSTFEVEVISHKNVLCNNCGARWIDRAYYWHDCDTWEAVHKKKIRDFRDEAVADKPSYVADGGFEKDLAVLAAQVELDVSADIAGKILNLMERADKAEPQETLNRIAATLGQTVGRASMNLNHAKKEAENG